MLIRLLWLFTLSLLVRENRTHAFVISTDAQGTSRHWETSHPDVSTNSVNPVNGAIRYYLGDQGWSAGNRVAELNAVRAAFAQWQAVPDSYLRFEEAGVITGRPDVNVADSTNVVYWANDSTFVNGGFDNISGTLAVMFHRTLSNNVLAEADIVLNGVQATWFTDYFSTNTSQIFIESTVLHEIGHLIGLEHSPVGGATMFPRSLRGVTTQAGLAWDDILGARELYSSQSAVSPLTGQLRLQGAPLFGGVVSIETSEGQAVTALVSKPDGTFRVSHLPPANYRVRVSPLDPPSNNSLTRLVAGADISRSHLDVQTAFLPAGPREVRLAAGPNTSGWDLHPGSAPFRITRLISPAVSRSDFQAVNAAITLAPGQSNLFIGIASPHSPPLGATLTTLGAGLTLGTTTNLTNAFPGSSLPMFVLYAKVGVAANTVPGLYSLSVTYGTNQAYAPGFLEVSNLQPDFNFDQLDDRFQRQHFPLFTSAEASPQADPDGDRFSNQHEAVAGTHPLDAQSLLQITHVRRVGSGIEIEWDSIAGKRYEVRRTTLSGDDFGLVVAITATSTQTRITIPEAPMMDAFFRVIVLP